MKELVRYKKGLNVLPVWGTYVRQSDPGFVCLFSGFCLCFPSSGCAMLCTCVVIIVTGVGFLKCDDSDGDNILATTVPCQRAPKCPALHKIFTYEVSIKSLQI